MESLNVPAGRQPPASAAASFAGRCVGTLHPCTKQYLKYCTPRDLCAESFHVALNWMHASS